MKHILHQIHFVGIGGAGMSGIAEVLLNLGYRVTGSDVAESATTKRLRECGAEIHIGHDEKNIGSAEAVVISTAVTGDNPEVLAARAAKVPIVPRAVMLGELMRLKQGIAIAGTHGKTTTSSMLAWILHYAGKQPNFLIGGVAPGLEVSGRYDPAQRLFVIEADEYDTAFFDKRSKFVHYRPKTAILNNLEYDHADIFPDLAAIETQFHHLVRTVPGQGRLVVNARDEALQRVLAFGALTDRVPVVVGPFTITPVRVGFTPTPSSTRSDPGMMLAATRKNAAEEISAGTSIGAATRLPPPWRRSRSSSMTVGRVQASE